MNAQVQIPRHWSEAEEGFNPAGGQALHIVVATDQEPDPGGGQECAL
jgi:hypothetical protein